MNFMFKFSSFFIELNNNKISPVFHDSDDVDLIVLKVSMYKLKTYVGSIIS